MRWMIILACVIFAGCSQQHQNRSVSWNQAMVRTLSEYTNDSRQALLPYFKSADLPYAPKELAFIIFKRSKKFELYARNNDRQRWRYVKTFPICAASGRVGPKLHSGDDQVPEGIYHIIGLNPLSHFDLSMKLNYPNPFDLQKARLAHRHNLGGNIFIHGSNRSIGCIALGNKAIQELFPLVYAVGERHVTVIIAPRDLRKDLPVINREHLPWVKSLYARLRNELKQFPVV